MGLWRVEQAAEYLGIRPKTLYEWVRLGRVPYRKIGFNVRFDPDELKSWTKAQSPGGPRSAVGGPGPTESKTKVAGGAPGQGADRLRTLALDAARIIRELEREVGASLSYPRRRELSELVERLEDAADASESDRAQGT